MATTSLVTIPNPPSTANNNLFAAVDMGTNSFKLLIVRADPSNGRFLTLDRRKEPVVLGRDSASISHASQFRAIDALSGFKHVLQAYGIPSTQSRFVATSAVREASNQLEFLGRIRQSLGLDVDVLSGFDEARLTYNGVLQFYPVHQKTVLTIDIGGGSTEFAIGTEGRVLMGVSLSLGHVTLTQNFVNKKNIKEMREHIRTVIQSSGLITKLREHSIDTVIGSSGTIRAIEKAISFAYASETGYSMGLCEGCNRDWKFSKEELGALVGKLCEGGEGEKVRKEGFFRRRSEFIVAGAILLEETFGMLGIEQMEVSGYGLAEGVIAEKLAMVSSTCNLEANARWRSVMSLATRFNNEKRMKSAALCACIAKEMFEGMRKWKGNGYNQYLASMDDHDLEYLEAACLLHNIGLYFGKKGYHKQSYHAILNGNQLHGYANEEVKLIAHLVRHHRKKIPKLKHASLQGLTEKIKGKFGVLCAIIRVSAAVVLYLFAKITDIKFYHSNDGFKLELMEKTNLFLQPAARIIEELKKELEHFEMVFKQKLSIVVPASPSGTLEELNTCLL